MYSVYMLRMQVYIPEEIVIDLKNLAAVEDVSMSEIVRRSLRRVLKVPRKKLNPLKEFVGKGKAKFPTDATKEIANYYKKFSR